MQAKIAIIDKLLMLHIGKFCNMQRIKCTTFNELNLHKKELRLDNNNPS